MKGDDAHAYSLITEVLAAKPSPAFKYLGSLMGGAVLERSRQFDAAAKSYVEAILAMPDGQSAYLALANILHKSGQKAEAGRRDGSHVRPGRCRRERGSLVDVSAGPGPLNGQAVRGVPATLVRK